MLRTSSSVESPLFDDVDAEAIEAVFARLASVEVDGLTPAGCEQWLEDALRVSGWLTVTRLRVEQAQWELTLVGWQAPEPEPTDQSDLTGDPAPGAGALRSGDHGADAAPGPEREAGADAGAKPSSGADAPGRTSRRREARDRRIKHAIALLPAFGAKLERGALTEDHVLAVGAIRNRDAAREREAAILAAALKRTAEDFATWLCAWDARVDLDRHGNLTERQRATRKLQLFDRSREFRGTLAPADFDAFKRTLVNIDAELERRRDHAVRLSWDQRMADALVEMTHRARGAGGAGDASLRTAVVVFIDLDDLLRGTGHGTTADGSIVDVGEVRRLAATEHVIPVVLGADSVPLDMGRAQRYANDAQWLTLLARDGGCVLCDAPLGTLDAHHCPEWHNGGSSDLCSMCLCCTRCHRKVHAERITLTFTGGRINATRPDGTPVPTHNRTTRRPPPAAPTHVRAYGTTMTTSKTVSLHHAGVTVSDLDRSIAFYRDVVGMELTSRRRMQGAWFDTLTHNEGADIDVAMLRLGTFTLQLVQYHAAGGDTLPLAHHHVGNPHLCVNVTDVDAKHVEAVAHGQLNPTPIVDIAGSGIRSFYVHDPDGLPVEFVQGAPT